MESLSELIARYRNIVNLLSQSERKPLPAGSEISWRAICADTSLRNVDYPT